MWIHLLVSAALIAGLSGCTNRHSLLQVSATRTEAKSDGIDRVSAEYFQKRSPDGQPIGMDRLLAARQHMQKMPRHGNREASKTALGSAGGGPATIGNWQFLGPNHVGGRTRSLIIRPDNPLVMYAGSVSGGVWQSLDGGQTWNALDDQMANLSIGALAMDPNDPNTIYAGTGEVFTGTQVPRGTGIFKTSDGGATWTQLDGTANSRFQAVSRIVVSNDSQRVYAAGSGAIMMSADAGQTWTTSLVMANATDACQELVIRTDQPTDYLFAGCNYRPTTNGVLSTVVFRNTDAAGSGKWTIVLNDKNMGRTTLAIAPSNPSLIYALSASRESGAKLDGMLAFYRSTSNGDAGTWEVRTSNTDSNKVNISLLSNVQDVCSNAASPERQGTYDNTIAVDPQNQDRVWAGGIELFRSDDGGATWGMASPSYATPHPDHHVIVFPPNYDASSNPVLFVGNDGGLWTTSNANDDVKPGCTGAASKVQWSAINQGYAVTQFYQGAAYPGGQFYFGGAQDNGNHRGSDATGADSWLQLTGADGGNVAVDPNNVSTIYYQNQNLALMKSTDGGVTRSTITTGITEPASDFAFVANPIVIDPNQTQRLYVAGRILWRSDDGGAHWTQASPNFGARISSIAVAKGNSNWMLLGAVDGSIYNTTAALASTKDTTWHKSTPRGVSWVTSVNFDPTNPSIAYATIGTYNSQTAKGHVFKSVDGGGTWKLTDGTGASSLPDVPFHTLAIDPQNPAAIYAGSDFGVFFSSDAGNNWAMEQAAFATVETEGLQIDVSGGVSTLFAFTFGRGFWRVPLGLGLPCTYSLSRTEVPFTAFGGDTAINVTTQPGCVWSAAPASGIASTAPPSTGKGNGIVTIHAPVNDNETGAAVDSVVAVGDQLVTVRQGSPVLPPRTNLTQTTAAGVPVIPYVVYEPTNQASFPTAASAPVHSCTGATDNRGIWFRYTATFTGKLQVTAAQRSNAGGTYDSVLTAYSGSGTASDEIACDHRANATRPQSILQFNVTQGQTYLVQSSSFARTTGAYSVITFSRAQ